MKTFRKMTALFVAVVFLLSSLTGISVFADDAAFTDVAETNAYRDAIYTLVAEGVINGYEDGTFKPEATITRAEFSKLLAVSSAPKGTLFSATTTQFSDIADSSSPSAWAIPYVSYAVGIKAINGYEDGTFRPTNPVTYGEAIKMIVCTLGYGAVVDTTLNPWYQGYVNIAMQIGLTKGAMSVGSNPAPRGLVAQLIYNMRNCKQLVNSGIGADGNPTFKLDDDDSYSTTESEDGILLGVFDFCLTDKTVTKSQVLIDDELYQIGDLDRDTLADLVGYSVSFQYSTTGTKPELTRVTKNTGDNEIIEIEDWQIVEITDSEIQYYEDEDAEYDDEATTIRFASDFYIVYNGVVVPVSDIDADFIKEYLNVENGTIRLLSNDSNSRTAEVAFVENYVTYFVNTSSTVDGVTTFYDKFTKLSKLDSLSLDEDEVVSVKKITTANGNLTDVGLSGITKNSVTSVAIPYGTKEGTIVRISTATVNGTVKEISNDYSYVKIEGKEYKFAPYFHMLLDGGEDVELGINDGGKFYLDYLGRIVYFEKTNSPNPYALLVQYKKGSGIDSGYQVSILNSSKGLNGFKLAETVRINGDPMSTDVAIAYLESSAPNHDKSKPDYVIQPIKYKTSTENGKSVISEIECMAPALDNYEGGNIAPYAFKNTVNKDAAAYFANGGTLTYEKSGYAFKNGSATQFRMNSSTVVFIVPDEKDLTKTDLFSKKTYSYFSHGNFEIEPYDVEKDIAKVVVVYGSSSGPKIYGQTPVYLVQDITDKNNSEGQATKNIVYIKSGATTEEEKLVANETAVLGKVDGIQPGDLIKFVTEDNEIVDIQKVYSTNAAELYNETGAFKIAGHHITKAYSTSSSDLYEVIYGTVIDADIDENTVSLVPALASADGFDASAYDTWNINDSTSFYKYSDKKGFEASSMGEIAGKGYSDYAEADVEMAKEKSAKIVMIVMDQKVTAVYILGE